MSILTRRKLLFLKREGKTVKMSLAAYWQELPVCVYTNESWCWTLRLQQQSLAALESNTNELETGVGGGCRCLGEQSRGVQEEATWLYVHSSLNSLAPPGGNVRVLNWVRRLGSPSFFYFFRINDIDCRDYLDRKFPVFRWGRWWEWWMLDCRAAESLIGSLLLLSSRLWRVSSCVSSA